ncbi:MAG: DciA family protein [Betaproteobacteria bacterium]
MSRPLTCLSVLQAGLKSPTLARLADLSAQSEARRTCIDTLIPAMLRSSIKAGPIEDGVWCLVVDNTAVASKLRQLLPKLESHLRSKGWDVNAIRIKVRSSVAA